jgi:hypothetical protein
MEVFVAYNKMILIIRALLFQPSYTELKPGVAFQNSI